MCKFRFPRAITMFKNKIKMTPGTITISLGSAFPDLQEQHWTATRTNVYVNIIVVYTYILLL